MLLMSNQTRAIVPHIELRDYWYSLAFETHAVDAIPYRAQFSPAKLSGLTLGTLLLIEYLEYDEPCVRLSGTMIDAALGHSLVGYRPLRTHNAFVRAYLSIFYKALKTGLYSAVLTRNIADNQEKEVTNIIRYWPLRGADGAVQFLIASNQLSSASYDKNKLEPRLSQNSLHASHMKKLELTPLFDKKSPPIELMHYDIEKLLNHDWTKPHKIA